MYILKQFRIVVVRDIRDVDFIFVFFQIFDLVLDLAPGHGVAELGREREAFDLAPAAVVIEKRLPLTRPPAAAAASGLATAGAALCATAAGGGAWAGAAGAAAGARVANALRSTLRLGVSGNSARCSNRDGTMCPGTASASI